MITGVTLNPCNDMMVSVPEFVYGGMNRVHTDRMDIAGKGYNFARTIAKLGMRAGATGLLYTENGKTTEWALRQDGVFADCVWQEGRIRTNIKLFDEKKQVVTEINQYGTPLTKTAIEEIKIKVVEFARRSELMVFSGSLPPGSPVDLYKTLIELCAPYCKTALDADAQPLMRGMEAKPYMVKPNKAELEAALGHKLASLDEIAEAMWKILDKGIEVVAVTMGDGGSMIAGKQQMYFAERVPVQVMSTVGAGDAMMAGICAALFKGGDLQTALRVGTAAAAAACTLPGTQIVSQAMVDAHMDRVEILPYAAGKDGGDFAQSADTSNDS